MGFSRPELIGVGNCFSDHWLKVLIEGVNRKVVGAGIVYLMRDDGVVAFFPVRSVELLRPVDLHTILEAMLVPNVSINDKLGWVVPKYIKMGSQEIYKKTAPTCV